MRLRLGGDVVTSTESGTYGIMYGMRKTTVYLPDDLKVSLERLAASEQRSEAEIIREALRSAVSDRGSPSPRIPLSPRGLGDPTIAERTDELLEGFGSR
jgi:Arc/MetJ-type ribon-helix-helix transcriptional regulator